MINNKQLATADYRTMRDAMALTHGTFTHRRNINLSFNRLHPIDKHFINFSIDHLFSKCTENNVKLTTLVYYPELLSNQAMGLQLLTCWFPLVDKRLVPNAQLVARFRL